MQLTPLDWLIVVATLALSFAPAVWMARRAGSSTAEFFTSGRSAPWWLIGVSMVATTFSSDTPNWVTEQVRRFVDHHRRVVAHVAQCAVLALDHGMDLVGATRGRVVAALLGEGQQAIAIDRAQVGLDGGGRGFGR